MEEIKIRISEGRRRERRRRQSRSHVMPGRDSVTKHAPR